MEKISKTTLVFLLALFCLINLSYSQGSGKTCEVEFASSGACYKTFGLQSCYTEAIAKYGPRPPTKYQCIPHGSGNRSCKCTVYCSQTEPAAAAARSLP